MQILGRGRVESQWTVAADGELRRSTVSGNNITLRANNVRGVGAEVAAENNIRVDAAEDVTLQLLSPR